MTPIRPGLPPAPTSAPATRSARPALATAAPPPPLSPDERARIAQAFPERPEVAQRLYGPTRTVHSPAPLGAQLDLSA